MAALSLFSNSLGNDCKPRIENLYCGNITHAYNEDSSCYVDGTHHQLYFSLRADIDVNVYLSLFLIIPSQ
jgi:hypothetical protein